MEILNSWLVNRYIAHHGLHDIESPENSLSAITKATDKDYAVLICVRQIGDGTLVVYTDETLKDMTACDGYIANIASKDSLKNYKLKSTTETIPTLSEALKTIGGKVPVVIEVKNFGKVGKLEQILLDALKTYAGEYAVASYNPHVLEWFAVNAPEVLRGQMSSTKLQDEISIKMNACKRRGLKKMKLNKLSQPNFVIYEITGLKKRYLKRFRHIPLIGHVAKSQQEYIKAAPYCDNIVFEGFAPHI
jgi:glycerophosphoryl diester phosphodiesterase